MQSTTQSQFQQLIRQQSYHLANQFNKGIQQTGKQIKRSNSMSMQRRDSPVKRPSALKIHRDAQSTAQSPKNCKLQDTNWFKLTQEPLSAGILSPNKKHFTGRVKYFRVFVPSSTNKFMSAPISPLKGPPELSSSKLSIFKRETPIKQTRLASKKRTISIKIPKAIAQKLIKMTERTQSSISLFGATCLASTLYTYALTPFDVIKTVQQYNPKYTLVNTIRQIKSSQGVFSFWRGAQQSLYVTLMSNLLYYISYEKTREQLDKINPTFSPFASAALCRTFTVTLLSPLDILRTQIQATGSARLNLTLDTAFKGLRVSLIRDIIFSTTFFGITENIYSNYKDHGSDKVRTAASVIGGLCATVLTQPFDVLKTRYQTKYCCYGQMPALNALAFICKEEGIRGVGSGFYVRSSKLIPGLVIYLTAYEKFKSMLSKL